LQKVNLKINSQNRIKNAKNYTAWHLLDIAVKNIWLDLFAKKWFHFDTWCYVEYSWIYNVEEKNKDFWCGCWGTHIKSTWELKKVEITNIKNKKWNCKISYRIG